MRFITKTECEAGDFRNVTPLNEVAKATLALKKTKLKLSNGALKVLDRLTSCITNGLDVQGCAMFIELSGQHLILSASNIKRDVKETLPVLLAQGRHNEMNPSAFSSIATDHWAYELYPYAGCILSITVDVTPELSLGFAISSELENDHLTEAEVAFSQIMMTFASRIIVSEGAVDLPEVRKFTWQKEVTYLSELACLAMRLMCSADKSFICIPAISSSCFVASSGIEGDKEVEISPAKLRFFGRSFLEFTKPEASFLEENIGADLVNEKYLALSLFDPLQEKKGYWGISKSSIEKSISLNDMIVCNGITSALLFFISTRAKCECA